MSLALASWKIRPQHRVVPVVLAPGVALRETGDVAGEEALAVVLQRQLYGHAGAQEVVHRDVLLQAQQVDLKLADTAELLLTVHPMEQQHLAAKRRGDLHQSG
jgi:hypothetical protein